MIAATLSEDGTPVGRRFLQQWNIPAEDEDEESFSVHPTGPETVSGGTDSSLAAELYRRGRWVVWSRNNHVLRTFRAESSIAAAFPARFHDYPKRPSVVLPQSGGDAHNHLDPSREEAEMLGKSHSAVCILEESTLKVFYTEEGEDFLVSVPFPVKKIWTTHYGLLIETLPQSSQGGSNASSFEQINASENFNAGSMPSWLCLLHPLDDYCRIMLKQQGQADKEQTQSDGHQIVFMSESPSLCLTYNKRSGRHTAWIVRPATVDESSLVEQETSMLFQNPHSASATPKRTPLTGGNNTPNRLLSMTAQYSGTATPVASSFAAGLAGSGSTSFQTRHRSRTSLYHPPGGAASISRSPAACASPFQGTPASASRSRMINGATPSSVLMARLGDGVPQVSAVAAEGPSTTSPDVFLCLEEAWREPQAVARRGGGAPSIRAFIVKDPGAAPGATAFLCYMQEHASTLAMVALENSAKRVGWRLGAVYHIPAVDAAPVPDIGMVLVMEPGKQAVALYSGQTKLGRVTFNSNPPATPAAPASFFNGNSGPVVANIAHEISAMNLDSGGGPRGGGPSQSLAARLATPRSSVLTSSRPPSAAASPASSAHPFVPFSAQESPVLPLATARLDQTLVRIGETVSNRADLHYSSGNIVRIHLPSMSAASGPFVELVLEAACAPNRECSTHLRSRWYATRNAPGPASLSPNKEWRLFTQCLLALMGYQTDRLTLFPMEEHPSPGGYGAAGDPHGGGGRSKKPRRGDSGSDGDWVFLLKSTHHLEAGQGITSLLGLEAVDREEEQSEEVLRKTESHQVDSTAPLFAYVPQIVACLHILYEDLKLDRSMAEHLPYLGGLLVRLAADLNLPEYVTHYAEDFPSVCPSRVEDARTNQVSDQLRARLLDQRQPREPIPPQPVDVRAYLLRILQPDVPGESFSPLTFVGPSVSRRSRDLVLCYAILAGRLADIQKFVAPNDPEREDLLRFFSSAAAGSPQGDLSRQLLVARLLALLGYDGRRLELWPPYLALAPRAALNACRNSDEVEAGQMATVGDGGGGDTAGREHRLIGREDLFSHAAPPDGLGDRGFYYTGSEDGMENLEENEIAALRWPDDKRLVEVRNMMQSADPVPITVTQGPEVSDHDFVEEQERQLHSICVRTMALPVGRGALTLFMSAPLLSEPMPVPKLCLSGKAPPRGNFVEMEHIDVVPNMDRWPLFHNGVAAGLRISRGAKNIDSSWITFNRPKERDHSCLMLHHAGLLLALGLGGHMSKLGRLESFDYLMRGHELVSIGVLLGVAASKRGSMDIIATKKISTQLVALLPPSATELPLSQATQTAALMSLGLLYQGTGHRHMAEVCLGELGRPPGPELENCTDRESYSLSAGLALGMITFGKGPELTRGPLSDLDLPDQLYYHMVGGPRAALAGGTEDAFFSHLQQHQSFQVKEGDTINLDVTGPGATLALGMMFFDSGNEAVAAWMEAPATQHLLEFVRPDFLMLRTIAKGLIMWSRVTPTLAWVESHVPEDIRPYCLVRPSPEDHPPGIDYETINQAYCNIVAGACLALALRFAGSHNAAAFEVLHSITHRLVALSKRSVSALAGRATIEQAICVQVLSLSIVMAGSGDLEVIRIIRYLRSRVGTNHSTVTYGSHVALHLALGLLFLGGGNLTLSTEPMAVAAMICAFFPKFPTHSNDNRYHLQAFRHLYVLAAEPRLLAPVDADSGAFAYAHVSVKYKATPWYDSCEKIYMAPVVLPELKYIESVTLKDERYHGFSFNGQGGLETLKSILQERRGHMTLQQKAGCLPYTQDPLGYRSLAARTLSGDTAFQWTSDGLGSFSSDLRVKHFTKAFLPPPAKGDGEDEEAPSESLARSAVSALVYDCATHERMPSLKFWMSTFQVLRDPSTVQVLPPSEIRWLVRFLEVTVKRQQGEPPESNFISPEVAASALQRLNGLLSQTGRLLGDLMATPAKPSTSDNPLKCILNGEAISFS